MMSSFRSDAIGDTGATPGGINVLKGLCDGAFRSDGGPCACCGCIIAGAAYRFDRAYMWRNGIGPQINPPANYQLNFNTQFREVRAVVDLGNARTEIVLEDVIFAASFVRPSDLHDRSYDGHCGFGTGDRDVDPAGSWVDETRPVDRGTHDSIRVYQTNELDGTSTNNMGRGSVFIRPTTGGVPVEIPLASIRYRVDVRIIADSKGHNESREGMISRMRGKESYRAGADRYAPCVLIEAKISLLCAAYDRTNLSPEQLSAIGSEEYAPINAAGNPAMHDHLPIELASDGGGCSVFGANSQIIPVTLFAVTLKSYLISGQSRASAFIGAFGDNAFNGADGYPPNGTASEIFEVLTSPAFEQRVLYTPQEINTSVRLASERWERDMIYDFDLGTGEIARYEERVILDAMDFGLTIQIADEPPSNRRMAMLAYNPGWTPGDDPSGVEVNGLAVSIYRRCGTVCGDDWFAPFIDPDVLIPRHILIGDQVHGYVGQTIIRLNDDRYVPDPVPSLDTQCSSLGIAAVCDPVMHPDSPPIKFRKDASFVSGGTTVVDGVRYRHVIGSTHSDPDAPELPWTGLPCDGDGTDRRLAFACIPGTVPAAVTYDRGQMTPGSLSYVVGTAGDEIVYRLSDEISQAPITPGSFSDLACAQWPVAVLCGGGRRITYDPDLRMPGDLTFVIGVERFVPVDLMDTMPPSDGQWSTVPCPDNPCSSLVPNDPRCALPQYRDCPQCAGFDAGDPGVGPGVGQVGDGVGGPPDDPRHRAAFDAFLARQIGCVGCGG